jgi:ABC-2 type transport system ATP-binding protein
MIRCDDLRKSFRQPVLRGITFQVSAGEVLGYLGANGAGKTTTLRILTGQLQADAGRTMVGDWPAGSRQAKRIMGYVPEQPAVYEQLTPREYFSLIGALHDVDDAVLRRRGDALLEFFDLVEHGDQRMVSFSKGMKKKVVIASALLHCPQVLLLDEPLDGLDVPTALQFKELLRALAADGVAVLYTSHILDVVEKVCDRVVMLDQGVIAAEGTVESLRASAAVASLEAVFAAVIGLDDPVLRAQNVFARLKGA